jgi:hypothetical protein
MGGTKKLERIKKKIDSKFLSLKGINGTAIKMKDNEYVIVVYVDKINPTLKQIIPEETDGVKVCIEEIGEIKTL